MITIEALEIKLMISDNVHFLLVIENGIGVDWNLLDYVVDESIAQVD